jgi:ADP-heptose:LPS heptosyltransferase
MNIANRYGKLPQMRRILIIQLGDIGDIVWSLPAIQAVRDTYSGAEVAVLLREGSGSLLATGVFPPKIFEVRKGFRESLRLIRALRRERFDIVFDFRGDERGGYMAFVTGAPIRAALHYPSLPGLRNHLFTHLVSTTGEPMAAVGAADLSLYILKAFGIETVKIIPELRISSEVCSRAAGILADAGIPAPEEATGGGGKRLGDGTVRRGGWVTVNPFSRWSYKEWGLPKWVQILDWLWREFGVAAVIVGAPNEREHAGELCNSCAGKVYNLVGKTTLAELAGVLQRSRLHLGVDSAAPHIAAAVGTPTVTIYGPSDWRYWSPPGERNRVVVPEMACAPCHLKGCEGSGVSLCLDTLPVERVRAIIREALST